MNPVQIENADVAAVFDQYPERMREKLLFLRRLIIETAATTEGVGALEETLKWGEPSYLTPQTKSGSTVRIDWKKKKEDEYAIYFKCTTTLVASFREKYPTEFKYGGNRSIIFNEDDDVPVEALKACIAMALTYHLRKKSNKRKK
ncbi:MAG: DUF1801 domain-containing protein [Anaerolineaceae bacterium]|nr:DUF1801 domain-containing protein [Anaerolineaceae bacterium]MCB9098271.1 DUF1801 domain-containing protein [Anaerolineales bacterium]